MLMHRIKSDRFSLQAEVYGAPKGVLLEDYRYVHRLGRRVYGWARYGELIVSENLNNHSSLTDHGMRGQILYI